MTKKRPSRKGVVITPHKGGRTVQRSTTVTPEVGDMLKYLKKEHGISLGDIVDEAVRGKYQELSELDKSLT